MVLSSQSAMEICHLHFWCTYTRYAYIDVITWLPMNKGFLDKYIVLRENIENVHCSVSDTWLQRVISFCSSSKSLNCRLKHLPFQIFKYCKIQWCQIRPIQWKRRT
jgi:hypothetical protein